MVTLLIVLFGLLALWALLLLAGTLRAERRPITLRANIALLILALAIAGGVVRSAQFANFDTADARALPEALSNLTGFWLLFQVRVASIALYTAIACAFYARTPAEFKRLTRAMKFAVGAIAAFSFASIFATCVAIANFFRWDLAAPGKVSPPLLVLWDASILSNDLIAISISLALTAYVHPKLAAPPPPSLPSSRRMRELKVVTTAAFVSSASFLLRAVENVAEMSSAAWVRWVFGANAAWFLPFYYVVVEVVPCYVILMSMSLSLLWRRGGGKGVGGESVGASAGMLLGGGGE
jgi:hypothetical protein